MTAGQEVALAGEDQQTLTTLRMGLGWDKERTAGAIGTERTLPDFGVVS